MATLDAPTAGRARSAAGHASLSRKWLELALFLAPALALYVLFLIVPVVQAVHYSVYSWNGLGTLTDFVGLDNYREAFGDPGFRRGDGGTTGSSSRSRSSLQLPLALAVALLLNRPMRGRSLLRLIFFAPYVLSEAITAVIFLQILQPDGLVDAALESVGLGGLVQLWLADLGLVFYTLFVVITWKYIGFSILLFLAGLQGVPRELHEAAAMDGASSWETLRYVTLPLLGPTIRICRLPRDHRLDPALRHRLDHDRSAGRRARRRRWPRT